ncbi:MAG: class I SAM-dependent methyltransferase [Nitrospirae bacterium]|nr:class I SAM-dependent methyltransferase [Nitrospirota bacterium]
MSIRKRLEVIYWFLEHLIIPQLKHSQLIYEEILKKHINKDSVWLDLGCGHQILPAWRKEAEKVLVRSCDSIVGIDYEHESLLKHRSISLKVRANIASLPFKSGTFDVITSNMVLEHVKYPEKTLKEVSLILKPGGIFIFHTTNLNSYSAMISRLIPTSFQKKLVKLLDNRKEEDTFTTYYLINTPGAIKEVAVRTGFNIKMIRLTVSSARLIVLPPLVILELLWIRILMKNCLKNLRTNIVVILEKKTQTL